MGWAEDKERINELGIGITMLCGVFLIFTILTIWQTKLVWDLGREYINNNGDYSGEISRLVIYKTLLTALNPVLFFASALGLFFSNSKLAVYFAIGTVIYPSYGSLFNIIKTVLGLDHFPIEMTDITNLIILLSIIGFLLFSKDVQRVYKFNSRRLLTRDISNLWRKGRNRPSVEESEAASLHETFK